MQTATYPEPRADNPGNWFRRAEAWLDSKGRWAWIAATVVAFILFWPVGLALLVYMIWSNRMSSCSTSRRRSAPWARERFAPTGNIAFDTYREETLRRLEEEQEAFQAFLDRLRKAKDQTEFDQFMDERRTRPMADAEDDRDQPQAG
ncbi:MAG: DUF2852 domain-containing protein [Rubricella sp.]